MSACDRGLHALAPRVRGEDALLVVLQVAHLAVAALLQPIEEPLPVGAWIRWAKAHQLEAAVVGEFADQGGGDGHCAGEQFYGRSAARLLKQKAQSGRWRLYQGPRAVACSRS